LLEAAVPTMATAHWVLMSGSGKRSRFGWTVIGTPVQRKVEWPVTRRIILWHTTKTSVRSKKLRKPPNKL
jgi:hypothetical protein